MARQLSDDRATPAPPVVAEQPRPEPQGRPVALESAFPMGALSAALAAGLGCGALAAWALQPPASVEPSLATLLHGMVGIKALIFLGALALVLLRLRGAVAARALAGYCVGIGMSAAALVWLWGLSGLLVGSALFYGGLVVTYVTASRDPLVLAGLQRVLPSGRGASKGG